MSIVRNRGLPAFDTPCSRSTDPLCQGVGASPRRPRSAFDWRSCRKNASIQRMAANSGPMPLISSNVVTGAGVGVASAFAHSKRRVPLGLHGLDLREQHFEAIELPADLRLQMIRQRATIACLQHVEPLATIAIRRLVAGYALAKQRKPLIQLTCSTRSAVSALRSRQRRRRSSSSGVSALTIAHTRGSPRLCASSARNSALAVDAVGLCPPAPARGRNLRRIDDVAFDPFILPQHAVYPRAIQSRFLNDDDQERSPRPRERLLPELRKAGQQRAYVSGGRVVFRHFLTEAPGASRVISQIERLGSKETKGAPRSLRMALGASIRSARTCIVVSRVGVCNLTLPERRSLSTSPWDLECGRR